MLNLVAGNELVTMKGLVDDEESHDDVVAQLRLTLRLMPTHHDQRLTHERLGRALMARDQLDEAVQHFRRALEIDPSFAGAHNNLGIAYAKQGRFEQALSEVRLALRFDPDHAEARQNLERMRANLRKKVLAEPPLPDPESPDAAELTLGRAYTRQFYLAELEQLHASFSEMFARQMPLDKLVEMHRTVTGQLGLETRLLDEKVVTTGEARTYLRRARFESFDGEVEVLVQLLDDDSIVGLMFRPAETAGEKPGS